jgi:NAD(P)H-nitrite reductase large subunit
MNNSRRIVIVGAGIAGFSAARTLAESGWGYEIVLVNGEDRPPYKRTKVSKNIARGFGHDDFALEPEQWYRESGIRLVSGTTVEAIETETRSLRFANGEQLEWSALILATGSTPAQLELPGADSAGVYVVQTASDGERLRTGVRHAQSILIIGGGVLGVELSEQLSLLGKSVTLCAAGDRLMPRQLNRRASRTLFRLLEENRIGILMGEPVREIRSVASAAHTPASIPRLGVLTSSGERSFDAVVACVGVRPSVGLAQKAGLDVRTGILVNEFLQTSSPAIFAAGDAAQHRDGFLSHLWHAAEYQGALAARNAVAFLESPSEPPPLTIFDNPRFRLKCEVFGRYYFSAGFLPGVNVPEESGAFVDTARVEVEEEREPDRYRLYSFRNDRLSGIIMINDPDKAKTYQKAIREGWDRSRVERELAW